jgi:hypothetical protein
MRRIADARWLVAAIPAADRVSIVLLFAAADASVLAAWFIARRRAEPERLGFWWSGAARERSVDLL